MDLQKFDSTLKTALDNIEVPYEPGTWAALESRLGNLPAPDAVDKALRPSLERMEMPYDSGSWSALAGKMDGLARVRKLRMTKLTEAAIFLLLLLNLKGFFGVVESVTHPAPAKKEPIGPVASAQPGKSKKQFSLRFVEARDIQSGKNESLTDQVISFVQNMTAGLTQDPENETLNTAANTPQPIASEASLLDPERFYSQSGLIHFPAGANLPAHPVEPLLYAGSSISIPGISLPKVSRNNHLYAATFGSFDKNYVKEAGYSDKKNGYGAGLAVGYRKGKWGVESGISYAQKNYKPKRENVEYQNDPNAGISFFYIDDVDAELFSVPVKVTRRIAKAGKTTAHAVAGVSANFATSKSYGYKTVHYPPPQPSPSPDPVTPYTAELPVGKGALENGGLTHNAYATADLGLRIEQSLGKRYVAFVEPVYRQSLGGGLGPKSARLSTFSLQAGVMASL